jgi:alpha,alpha-trehalase
LLPLPGPYIVPGGRFREVYYWDSYFTFLGLRESGEEALIESMVDNFAYLIEQYGYIPNGNRSYFLSRSQPPFFALMVEFLAEKKGDEIYVKYLPALRAELDYWMDRTAPTHHVVTMPNGGTLNRYYDQLDTPRPEAFAREEAVSHRSTQEPTTLYRNLRAACESGWDFSSRWFADGRTIETIQTTDIVPVDLNCLLYQLETTLAKAYSVSGDKARAGELAGAAQSRRDAIVKSFWADGAGYFCDFNLKARGTSEALTLAGVTPLFFHLATPEQAEGVMRKIKEKFLKPGGVVTTLVTTGQQWDAPNGWAPLQWLTIRGLENYGYHELAAEIAHRWLRLNTDVYNRTGKMMEKYNVVDTTLTAGGGEYPSQDGFGWTNGVFLKLLHTYPENK